MRSSPVVRYRTIISRTRPGPICSGDSAARPMHDPRTSALWSSPSRNRNGDCSSEGCANCIRSRDYDVSRGVTGLQPAAWYVSEMRGRGALTALLLLAGADRAAAQLCAGNSNFSLSHFHSAVDVDIDKLAH